MKTEKKLKQGLADLSSLFSGHREGSSSLKRKAPFIIQPPEIVAGSARPSRLVLTTVLSSSPQSETSDLMAVVNQLKASFQAAYMISIPSGRFTWELFCRRFSIPEPVCAEGERADIFLHPADEYLTFGRISPEQFQDVIRPQVATNGFQAPSTGGSALVVFDTAVSSMFRADVDASDYEVLGLIDHCIFIMRPEGRELELTYEKMRLCLARNQALRCSLLFIGQDVETLWESAYEGFDAITSQFLGYNVGFLGWVSETDLGINAELLLEETENISQWSSRARLMDLLFAGALSS